MALLSGCVAPEGDTQVNENPATDSSELGATDGDGRNEEAAQPAPRNVRSVLKNADGSTTESIYTPAEGITPEELATRLTADGVPDVTLDDPKPPPGVAPCSYGTARTWATATTCFARWSTRGQPRPRIFFRDRSTAAWPVGRAVTKWNETSGIDSRYFAFSQGCAAGGHCVIIYNAAYGATGWTGMTTRTLNAAGTYIEGAYIQLNETYGGTTAQRWNTACHEIGHVLGLDHNTSTNSCLYGSRTSVTAPSSQDFALLERYY